MYATVLASLSAIAAAQMCVNQSLQIPDPWYLATPAHGNASYAAAAAPWNSSSCCADNYTQTFQKYGVEGIYNGWSWNQCYVPGTSTIRNISAKCAQYLAWQEVSYSCDPYMGYFQDPSSLGQGYLQNVPVCQLYCDNWFDACRDDYTCVANWYSFNVSTNANGVETYTCPNGTDHSCQTYGQIYQNGTGLCNQMWGSTYVASANSSACASFWFWGSQNPNAWAAPASASATASSSPTPSASPSPTGTGSGSPSLLPNNTNSTVPSQTGSALPLCRAASDVAALPPATAAAALMALAAAVLAAAAAGGVGF